MLALPLMVFSVFLIAHALWWRLLSARKPGVSMLFFHGLFWFLVLMVAQLLLEPNGEGALYSASVYLFLLVAYFHLYVGIDRSVSIRVLGELSGNESGSMSQEQLRTTYSSRSMFSHRLELMAKNGWIDIRDGRYSNLPKGTKLARVAKRLRGFYCLEVTG